MLVALEGSSPTTKGENNNQYYVWMAYQTTKQTPKKYIKGPATISDGGITDNVTKGVGVINPIIGLGSRYLLRDRGIGGGQININTMSTEAVSFIRSSSGSIFLIGWSRGGAACIQVALNLKRQNYAQKIEAMFLFDPVDQDGSTGDFLNVIPNNVINCYRAKATKKEGMDKKIFPTCGNTYEPGVIFVTRDFYTTHGGIAGTEGGTNGDAGAGNWMWTNMAKHGVI